MTEAEALDLAAKAAGWHSWEDAQKLTWEPEGIRAHAKTIMENAALKAENEALKALRDDDGELLTIAWMDGAHSAKKAQREHIAALKAEIERLRETLSEIADIGDDVDCSDCKASGMSARAALAMCDSRGHDA